MSYCITAYHDNDLNLEKHTVFAGIGVGRLVAMWIAKRLSRHRRDIVFVHGRGRSYLFHQGKKMGWWYGAKYNTYGKRNQAQPVPQKED